MSLLNIVCPICTDVFNNSDNVYSTSCGHIFHFACLNDWQRRGTSCPQCRYHNPTTHKLYLSFDEPLEAAENIEEMKEKLKTSIERIVELEILNSEVEVNFMKLQEQYTAADTAKRVLEEKISEMDDADDHFLKLQGQFTESSELVKDLEDRIRELSLANERNSKELQVKILENNSLKAGQGVNQGGMTDSRLKQKIKILEQRLNNISEELRKEINSSTQLSIEKMKLESIIKNSKAMESHKQVTNKPDNREKRIQKNLTIRHEQNAPGPRNKCIIIKDIDRLQPAAPIEIIVNLASKFNLEISADDFISVRFMDTDSTKTKKLYAEFKRFELKERFLARKCMLNKIAALSQIKIREFMDEDVYTLYKYATANINRARFNCIYCANNRIYAKENNKNRAPLEIKSTQQVDELKIKTTNNSNSLTNSTETLNITKCNVI